MKIIAVYVLISLLLSGCTGQQQMDSAMAFRQKMTEGAGCGFLCTVTADYGDKLYTFSMDCSFDNAGNMTFSVVKPESISGITGTIGHDGGKLTFDDQALAFELLADGYISPVSAPWFFVKTVRGGFVQSCSQDGANTRITFLDTFTEEALQTDVWMDPVNIPLHCEILWQGRRILSLEVSNFSYL